MRNTTYRKFDIWIKIFTLLIAVIGAVCLQQRLKNDELELSKQEHFSNVTLSVLDKYLYASKNSNPEELFRSLDLLSMYCVNYSPQIDSVICIWLKTEKEYVNRKIIFLSYVKPLHDQVTLHDLTRRTTEDELNSYISGLNRAIIVLSQTDKFYDLFNLADNYRRSLTRMRTKNLLSQNSDAIRLRDDIVFYCDSLSQSTF